MKTTQTSSQIFDNCIIQSLTIWIYPSQRRFSDSVHVSCVIIPFWIVSAITVLFLRNKTVFACVIPKRPVCVILHRQPTDVHDS